MKILHTHIYNTKILKRCPSFQLRLKILNPKKSKTSQIYFEKHIFFILFEIEV